MASKFWSRSEDKKSLDYYPTPPYATIAILNKEHFDGNIWEPACGNGDMSNVIKDFYKEKEVICTDITTGTDFLSTYKNVDNIITNPPFNIALDFINHAKKCSNKKIALLLRNQFLESSKRYKMFIDGDFKFKGIYQFVYRVPFQKGKVDIKKGMNCLAFSWFVWDREWKGEPVIRWLDDKPSIICKKIF